MELAISAGKISVHLRLAMADSMMLATARAFDATFWTQDADFQDIEGVRYVEKRSWPRHPIARGDLVFRGS